MTQISTVEFPSKGLRDNCLKILNEGKAVLFVVSEPIEALPAKTKKQLRRNWAMNCALEMLQ